LIGDLVPGAPLSVSAPVFASYFFYIPSLFPATDERPPVVVA